MKSLIAFLAILLTFILLAPPLAEAKRLGGGSSLGKQYSLPKSSPAPQAPTVNPTPKPSAPYNAARPGSASRWLGPLAGLAAGGLLASLLFGDAFHGLQVMDFLLILGLIAGGILLFRKMRRGATQVPVAAGSVGASSPIGIPGRDTQRDSPQTRPASFLAAQTATMNLDSGQVPPWFDAQAFTAGARDHFLRLQAAWDKGDFDDIRAYTTQELFAELQRERQSLGTTPQVTEVLTLNVSLVGIQRDGDLAVASLEYSGLIREEQSGVANPFREIWHVQHAWETATGDWFIAGIQQTD